MGKVLCNKCNKNLIVKSKLSLIRNIRNNKFTTFLSKEDGIKLAEKIKKEIEKITNDRFKTLKIREESRECIGYYLEKDIITKELFNNKDSGEFLYDSLNEIVIMINEGNHIKISSVSKSLELKELYKKVSKIDDELDEFLDIAFDENLGYLTMNKHDLGTALKIEVILHLPILSKKEFIKELEKNLKKVDIEIKGVFGEDKNNGNFYKISNSNSLGFSEEDLITNLEAVANELIIMEKKSRNEMISDENIMDEIEDDGFRALGILTNSRLISFQESLTLLSKLRLAVELNFIKNIELKKIDNLIESIQYYNLKLISKKIFNEKEEKSIRARIIRECLKGENLGGVF